MLVTFDFETDSGEEVLKSKLKEAKGLVTSIEYSLSKSAGRKGMILDLNIRKDDDYF